MTVRELIAKLSAFDLDMEVLTHDGETYDEANITHVQECCFGTHLLLLTESVDQEDDL